MTDGDREDWVSPSAGRRPITPGEVPYLLTMGSQLRSLRKDARLSQDALAWGAEISRVHLSNIERGVRRTRVTTLRRIAAVLVDHLPNYAGSADDLATYLAILGGPTVAPESDYTERIERRRQRRRAKAERLVAAAFPLAVAMSKEMAVEIATERLYCTDCYQRRKRR